ncbi:MAG TPA: glycoside hydrolase family 3 C-terminal domain-containing protein [Acidimicrobiales bacterium]|nr:glycoside hydrolase family 3 C-terminal domain-containing protein [Acidimicrobiales bacterium]
MTIPDEIDIVEGHGARHAYVFYMQGIPSLCIPSMGLENGPAGVADRLTGVTELPSPVALAATFDPALADAYGKVIGAEELGKGASVNLGPTVNIDRDPRWGRSFETFSEDPFLSAAMAVGEIDGVQSEGEMSEVKHFDAYNQETYRNTPEDDVIVSDRALHEIYMPAFEAAVTTARAASVMCAYSMVDGAFSCDNPYLEESTLDDLWRFQGFVTADEGAVHSTSSALAGTDMEQPLNLYFGEPLQHEVESGAIPRSVLNEMVRRILTEMFRFGLFDHPPTGNVHNVVTTPAHQAVATEVAEDATVLLKNAGDVLSLATDNGGSVAVIGPAASTQPTDTGGGSAYVTAPFSVTPLRGITSDAGPGTSVSYEPGLPTDTRLQQIPPSDLSPGYSGTPFEGRYAGVLKVPESGTYVIALTNDCLCYTPTYLYLNQQELIADPSTPPVHTYSAAVELVAGRTYSIDIGGSSDGLTWATPSELAPGIAKAVAAARSARTAVVVVSDDTETEGADRPHLNLPSAQNELIEAVAAVNPRTVVVVDAGAPVEMPWLDEVAAVVDAWYPGESNGTALASVLFGSTDPSGHLPVTFPQSLAQVPAHTLAQFPGVNGRVLYSEGLDVGYRWYDAKGITPLFPFGFGLSYTTYRYSDLHVTPGTIEGRTQPTATVTAKLTNTGSYAGADVAQLYVGDPPAAGEPPRQLKGFQRVFLQPGHSRTITFVLDSQDLSWWSDSASAWVVPRGTFEVYVGDSSALVNLPLRTTLTVR